MNTTDLRAALAELAEPRDRSVVGPRAAVGRRVRRGRVVGGVALVAVLAIAAVGVVSVARVDDGEGTRVQASATTIHDERHGFSVVLPPGWKREQLPVGSIFAAGFDHEYHPEVTRRQFEDLRPIQSRRQQLLQQLQGTPGESADAARIRAQLAALAESEVEIRTRTDDIEPLQQQRAQLEQQLADPSTAPSNREVGQRQLDAITQAEAEIRSRPAGACRARQTETGVSVALFAGPYDMPGGPSVEPRPPRFGRDSGNGTIGDPRWPPCSPRRQTIRFTDAGREFGVTLVVAPGVSATSVDEAYAILDSLRFTPAPSPSG